MTRKVRSTRYNSAVLFFAGIAGCFLLAAALRHGLTATTQIALAGAYVIVLALYALTSFRLTEAEQELAMTKRLVERFDSADQMSLTSITPEFPGEDQVALTDHDKDMLVRLKNAIESDRIDLYLQPIVSLPQRKTRFYEAYSRLRDLKGNLLLPREYLDIAERTNRIGVIDNLILLRCVTAMRKLRTNSANTTVFCNISPATLYDAEFFAQFTSYLTSNYDLSKSLVFEFTWPALQIMHPRVEENLALIASKGFAFSVDNLISIDVDWDRLSDMNFRYAKIPSHLLASAHNNDHGYAQRIRQFRKKMSEVNIDLIVEKVEIENDMPEILELGIDYGEGNLFGSPRSAEFYLGDDIFLEVPQAKAS